MKAYPELPEEQSEDALYFMNLLADDCRWPISADMFCGAPVEPGKPYCPKHCDRAYVGRKLSSIATKEEVIGKETTALTEWTKDLTPKHIGAIMHSGSILIVKPKQMPPDELLDKLVAANKTMIGFAGVSQGAIDIQTLDSSKLDFKANIKEWIEAFSDSWNMIYLAENKSLLKEDYMPMKLIDNEEKGTLIAVAAEGDFPGLVKKGDAHIPEHNLIMDHLAEDVNAILEEAGGDLEKAEALLDSARFRRSLKQHMVPRGSVSLLLANNKIITFSEKAFDADGPGFVGDWGSVSRRFGWEPPKVKVEQVTTKAAIQEPDYSTMSAVARIKARKEYEAQLLAAQGDAPIIEEPVTSVPGTGPQPRVLEPTTTHDLETVTCSETGKKQRREWLWKHFGQNYSFPTGWIEKNFKFPAKDLTATSPLRTFLENERKKREAGTAGEQPTVSESKGVSTDVYPSLSPQSQKQVMNLVRDGVLKMDPGQVQAIEKPFDKFTDQLNLNEDVPLMWKTDAYLTLCQTNAMGAASLMEQMRRKIHELDPSLASRMLSKLQGTHKTDVPTDEEEDHSNLSAVERLKRRKQAA